jgi:hypothetical protein
MLNAAAPLAGKRVLEFGCGIGTYVREIRRFTPHVFGFDIEVDRLHAGLVARSRVCCGQVAGR